MTLLTQITNTAPQAPGPWEYKGEAEAKWHFGALWAHLRKDTADKAKCVVLHFSLTFLSNEPDQEAEQTQSRSTEKESQKRMKDKP